jgi:hypothetical protein
MNINESDVSVELKHRERQATFTQVIYRIWAYTLNVILQVTAVYLGRFQ